MDAFSAIYVSGILWTSNMNFKFDIHFFCLGFRVEYIFKLCHYTKNYYFDHFATSFLAIGTVSTVTWLIVRPLSLFNKFIGVAWNYLSSLYYSINSTTKYLAKTCIPRKTLVCKYLNMILECLNKARKRVFL